MRPKPNILAAFMCAVLAMGFAPSTAIAADLAASGANPPTFSAQTANPVLQPGKAHTISFKGSIQSTDLTINVKTSALVTIKNSLNSNADSALAMLQDAGGESLGVWHPAKDKQVGQFALRPGTYTLNYLIGSKSPTLTTSATVTYTTVTKAPDNSKLKNVTVEKFFSSDEVSTYLNSDLSKISTPAAFGKEFVGTLCAPPTGTDIDYYSFTVKEAGPYSVLLRGWSRESRMAWLCDSKGNTLKNAQTKATCVSSTGSAGVAGFDCGKLKKGTYYLAIGPQSTASYTKAEPYGGYVYKDIYKAKVTGIKNKKYTGKKITQNITVTWNGVKLKKGRDYGVSYYNNKNAGTATVEIYPKGEFAGSPVTIMKTFKIRK